MAHAVFIVCSESGSVDRYTNQLSIFNVIERISIKRLLAPPNERTAEFPSRLKPLAISEIRMVALWRRDDGESGKEFDFRTSIQAAGRHEPEVISEGQFVFKNQAHRIMTIIYTDPPTESGTIIVEHSIKPAGTDDWIIQKYPIPVDVADFDPNQRELPLS